MTENETRCVVCTKARMADVGLMCSAHLQKLSAMLRDVEDEAAILSAVPSMAVRTGSGGGSLASTRSPARINVLVHTDRRRGTGARETEDDAHHAGSTLSVYDVLHSWARLVREERHYATRGAHTISGERDTLTRALDWVAAQPWVDECYKELRALLSQLQAVNGTQPERPVGRCFLPIDTGLCDGPIWMDDSEQVVETVTGTWRQMAPGSAAHCGRCSTTWTGTDLHRLAVILEHERRERRRPKTGDGRPMLTADELVARGHVSSVSNVRVKAHRAGVVSVDGHYDPAWFDSKVSA